MAYIVLGHGAEKKQRHIVPPGCTLVLSEECGMTSVFPHQAYPILADPANLPLFTDPVTNKTALEALLHRPIHVYPEGSEYPEFSYTLRSDTNAGLAPSGFYALPTPSFVFQSRRGEARYLTTSVARATEGSLLPPVSVTQSALFQKFPGVHYNFLCRVLEEEERVKSLIARHFPDRVEDIFTAEGDDPFQAAAIWMSHTNPRTQSQRDAIREIQQIVDDVMAKRTSVDPPIFTMLAMRPLPPSALQAIRDLDDVDRSERRNGYTPLMLAALMGHREAVAALLGRGANVNARDNEGSTPLMFACTSDPAIAMMMLEHDADPRPASDDGVTALHIAAGSHSMAHVIRHMLARGAIQTADDEGDMPLHSAATPEIVEILVAAGADPNKQNNEGLTPIMVAIEQGDTEVALALIPLTNLALRSRHGTSALGYAIKAKQDAVAVALIEAGVPVPNWEKVVAAAREYGLPGLEVVARERRRRRRNARSRSRSRSIKKSTRKRSGRLHEGRS